MKSVRLLTLTSLNYLAVFLVLTLFFFGVFFYMIRHEVYSSTDEVLYNRKMHIQEEFNTHENKIPEEVFGYSDFVIASGGLLQADRYSDTLIYETVDQEWDEFRKLTTSLEAGGKYYKLEIVVARLETHEIVESVLRSLFIVFILIVIAFYLTSRYLSRRLWHPFYHTLRQLNNFEIDQSQSLTLVESRIEEFETLNKSIVDLTDRIRNTFINQKQFIENASHEMQTPLAITQSKLELLIEDPNLTEAQSEIVQTLINSTARLARLNKTLLLLSKIENQQFPEKENVLLKELIDEILVNFEEQQENLKIEVKTEIEAGTSIQTNRTMIDLLLTNLIKNSFFHNKQNGSIHIQADHNRFSISNSSEGDAIPQEKLFLRFYKQSVNKESWGLGLAMVKKICDLQSWKITYSIKGHQHQFIVNFSSIR